MNGADAFRQLFVNLILNSFQAMEGRGQIRVEVTVEEGGRLQIVYQDSGPGIAPEHRERVFDPFFTTKAVGEGTGLGLFIVANIVEEHAGEIRVDDGPGGGARFWIVLPQTLAGSESTADLDGQAPTPQGVA